MTREIFAGTPRLLTRLIGLPLVASLAAACVGRGPAVPLATGATAGPTPPYLLKVGDTLNVRFYKTPELNAEVPIRSDGKISLELIGDIDAAGLEPDQLSRILSERYANELSAPRVTVIVRSFGGQVYVGGEVKNPSVQAFTSGLTALQAINAAGGFLNTARLDDVILIRRSEGQYRGLRVSLEQVVKGTDPSTDVVLQPSDIIHVPRSKVAKVNLFVEQYIRNNLPVSTVPASAF